MDYNDDDNGDNDDVVNDVPYNFRTTVSNLYMWANGC